MRKTTRREQPGVDESEQNKMVKRSVRKLGKIVGTRSVGMEMCIGKNIENWFLREIFEENYFSEGLRRISTGCSERGARNRTDIGGEDRVIPLYPFLLVGVSIWRRSL